MSDTWKDILDFKSRQSSLKEKLQKRKQERQGLLNLAASTKVIPISSQLIEGELNSASENGNKQLNAKDVLHDIDSKKIEERLLQCLCDVLLTLPVDSRVLNKTVSNTVGHDVPYDTVENLLQKFSAQALISVKEGTTSDGKPCLVILSTEHDKLVAVSNELMGISARVPGDEAEKNEQDEEESEPHSKVVIIQKDEKKSKDKDILSLLSMPSIREKENKKVGEEILDLLSKPTAKERSLAERFKSQGGAQVQEFCPHGTKDECNKMSNGVKSCHKLHFRKIIQKHTDESLGDCSFLNTCFHMDTCKYVHYEVDSASQASKEASRKEVRIAPNPREATILYKPQWIQCDLRFFDMTVLGKFAVVMADPPWDIHMELPYGTMSDDEMRALNIPCLQDEGLIFLWVTGRAMELGRECLTLWGYERVDELIWVKTNQLQRIIRTGRTGHWLNHGKEHCLVGMKGDPNTLNRGLDCDVIVAEVRATSHKPDEIYGIIERLSPGTRKIELFGRQHNVQPNWITLGNQLDGVRLLDPELVKNYQPRYPDGVCMGPGKTP